MSAVALFYSVSVVMAERTRNSSIDGDIGHSYLKIYTQYDTVVINTIDTILLSLKLVFRYDANLNLITN